MMRMETNAGLAPPLNGDSGGKKRELRPGGMLVQKHTDEDSSRLPPPKISVRVKYGEINHEIDISSETSFGELKKLLSGVTGLHHQDQKLYYKNRERDSKAFLDTSGVKDKSKLVLLEDPISKEKRYLEMKKKSQIEKASIIISHISLQIDKLDKRFRYLKLWFLGEKVVHSDLIKLNDSLMNQLIQLDNVPADYDAKSQRVRKVQDLVQQIDALKLKNSSSSSTNNEPLRKSNTRPEKKQSNKSVTFSFVNQEDNQSASVVTTKWENFDSKMAPLIDASSSSSTYATSDDDHQLQPGFTWNLL